MSKAAGRIATRSTPVPARAAPVVARPAAPKIVRRTEQRDLAALVTWLREGRPSELPFRRVLERQVRGDLSNVETYRGERARRVADAVDARAFAVGNVIGFADDRPAFDMVAHEVAHVVQMLGPSPRRWTPTHPIGAVPWSNPYEHDARSSAFESLADHARGERAPIEIYRIIKETDALSQDEGALFGILKSEKYKVLTFESGQERFSEKQGGVVTPQPRSSAEAFDAAEATKVGYPAGNASDVASALAEIAGRTMAKRTFAIGTTRATLVKVHFDGGKPDGYAFLGDLDKDVSEVWAIPGAGLGKDQAKGLQILEAYKAIIAGLVANKALLDPVRAQLGIVETARQAAVADLPNKKTKGAVGALVQSVRHQFEDAVIDGFAGQTLDTLHEQIVKAPVWRQSLPGVGADDDSEASFERIKGDIVEGFVLEHLGYTFAELEFPRKGVVVPVQPRFGDQTGKKNEIAKSKYLAKLRFGDGAMLDGVPQDGTSFPKAGGTIAEVKGYTTAPTDEIRGQMDDYARIINIPIKGYFLQRLAGRRRAQLVEHQFTSVKYFVTGKDVLDKWIVALDQHLGTKYTLYNDPRLVADVGIDALLKAYSDVVAALGKKPKIKGLPDITKLIADAGTEEKKQKTKDERQPDVDAIQAAVVAAILEAYPAIDLLFDQILDSDKIFSGVLAQTNALVLKKWFEKYSKRTITEPALQAPMAGQKGTVRPVFTETPSGVESAWAQGVYAGTADLVILDQRIIIDRTNSAEPPTTENEDEAKDLIALHKSAKIYLINTGGAGERLQRRTLTGVEYQFASVVSQETLNAWNTKLLPIFGSELKTGGKVFISPDPKAENAFVLRFSLNPVFEAKVTDASTLEPALTVTTEHPGVTVTAAKVRLTAVRTPKIESGSITFSVSGDATKGLVSSEAPQTKTITPAPESQSKPSGKAKPIHGQVQNKLSNLKSKLSDLLKRIETDAKLTDDGLEGTLRVTAGPSGIPNVDLEDASVTVVVGSNKNVPVVKSVSGHVGISVAGGKLRGGLDLAWKAGALVITGKAHVENLIDGLAPIDATIVYTAPTEEKPGHSISIEIEKAEFKKKLGGVQLTGTARKLKYDSDSGTFSGTGTVTAGLGSFGTASTEVTITNNELSEAVITYESADLKYPAKNPVISGSVKGRVRYANGKITEGSVAGDATLRHPALTKLSKDPINLKAHVDVDERGNLSGGIALATPITLGDHFRIDSLSADIDPAGKIKAGFEIAIVNIPVLKGKAGAAIACEINESGFTVVSAKVELDFGEEEKSRFWGKFKVNYTSGAFDVRLDLGVKIKEGMFAKGWATYNTQTKQVDTGLTLPRIPLLTMPEKSHLIFGLHKEIGIVQVPGIVGLYIQVGFDLKFKYRFDLGAVINLKLKGFDLVSFAFKGASASAILDGDGLVATLEAAPRLGIGAFLFHPMILRGGGGIKVPIQGIAQLKPTKGAGIYFDYKPATENEDAKATFGAKVGLRMTFKVDAAIVPYAEFVALDGAFNLPDNPPWEGAPLASFELLPERELFTYEVDFGDSVEEETDPQMPKDSKAPRKADSFENQVSSKQVEGGPQVDSSKPEAKVEKKDRDPPKGGAEDKGFNFIKVIDGIVGDGKFKPIWEAIKTVADTIESIVNFIGKIVSIVKSWFKGAYDAMVSFLKGLKAVDYKFFKYLLVLLKENMNPTAFNVLEPILSMFDEKEDDIFNLMLGPKPTGIVGWLGWGVDLFTTVLSLSWDGPIAIGKSIYRFLKAMADLASEAWAAAKAFVGEWVRNGMLGARLGRYYLGSESVGDALSWIGIDVDTTVDFWVPDEWKIRMAGFDHFYPRDPDWPIYEFGSGPAVPIWGALDAVGAPKSSYGNYWDQASDWND